MAKDDHGEGQTYRNHGCRCAPCTKANAADQRAARERRKGTTPWSKHGLASSYENYGCRCPRCTKAATAKRAEQRKGRK